MSSSFTHSSPFRKKESPCHTLRDKNVTKKGPFCIFFLLLLQNVMRIAALSCFMWEVLILRATMVIIFKSLKDFFLPPLPWKFLSAEVKEGDGSWGLSPPLFFPPPAHLYFPSRQKMGEGGKGGRDSRKKMWKSIKTLGRASPPSLTQ